MRKTAEHQIHKEQVIPRYSGTNPIGTKHNYRNYNNLLRLFAVFAFLHVKMLAEANVCF